jgi:hypothetical protein
LYQFLLAKLVIFLLPPTGDFESPQAAAPTAVAVPTMEPAPDAMPPVIAEANSGAFRGYRGGQLAEAAWNRLRTGGTK